MEFLFIALGFLTTGAVGWGVCALINRIFFRFARGEVELYGSLLFFFTILILQIVLTIAAITTKNNLTALVEGLPGVGFAYLLLRINSPLKPISVAFVIYALIYSVGLAIFGYWGILQYLMNSLKWSGFGFAAMTILWLVFGMKTISQNGPSHPEEVSISKDDSAKPSPNKWTE